MNTLRFFPAVMSGKILRTIAAAGLCAALSLAPSIVTPATALAKATQTVKVALAAPVTSAKAKPGDKKAVTTTSTAGAKKVAAKKSVKKRRRSVYVRSLLPQETRAALRQRGITSGFGMRAVHGGTRQHKGIDVSAPKGSKIIAFNDGEVIFTGVKNGYGNTVVIRQIDGREALYAHMDSYVVKIGDQVRRGTHIGHVGRTGRATGCHVHFELIDNGEHLDPALHVWHGSELVLGPGDLDPAAPDQTRFAGPVKINLHVN